MIELVTHDLSGVTVIQALGRLDALASPQLDAALQQAADSGQARLLVDCEGVAYISSSCLRVLLLAVRRAHEAGGDLKLCSLSPRVYQVFSLAGFDLVFEIWPSRQEALAAFAAPPHPANAPGAGA